jgi:hypothetical protein
MSKNLQARLDAAQLKYRLYATAIEKLVPAYEATFAFVREEAASINGTFDARKAFIIGKFDAALLGLDNARDTLRVYLGDCISVACTPDVVTLVKAKDAKVGDKATVKLDVAHITTYRDLAKLATAARIKRDGKSTKPEKSGAQPAPSPKGIEENFRAMVKVQAGRATLIQWASLEGFGILFSIKATVTDTTVTQPAAPIVAPVKKEKRLSK